MAADDKNDGGKIPRPEKRRKIPPPPPKVLKAANENAAAEIEVSADSEITPQTEESAEVLVSALQTLQEAEASKQALQKDERARDRRRD